MILWVVETLTHDLQILARAAASAHSAMCWQHYCEVWPVSSSKCSRMAD